MPPLLIAAKRVTKRMDVRRAIGLQSIGGGAERPRLLIPCTTGYLVSSPIISFSSGPMASAQMT